MQQLFLSVDDVTSGPEVAAVARVIKKSAIALSRQGNRVLKKFKAHTFSVLSFCCQNSDLCQQPQQPCAAGCARVPASAWRWRTRGAWPGWSSSARSPDSGTDRGPQAQVQNCRLWRSPGSGTELSPLKVPRLRYRTVAFRGP